MQSREDQRILALKLITVHTLGVLVVLATGTLALGLCAKTHRHDRDWWPIGLEFILVSAAAGFFFFFYRIPFLLITNVHEQERHKEPNAFKFLKATVWIDLIAMLGLVCLTGGLSDSFYTPILVIIPVVAFLLQDKPDYNFTIKVFVVSFIFIGFAASVNLFGIEGWLRSSCSFDASNEHTFYNLCLLLVTIVGAGMPFIDVIARYYTQRDGGEPGNSGNQA